MGQLEQGEEILNEKDGGQEVSNSLTELFTSLTRGGNLGGSQLSQTDTQYLNLRYYLISNDRNLLSWMYMEHGIVQTLVDQPVDDAFREGFKLKTNLLDPDQIRELELYMEKDRVTECIKTSLKWVRLYGGGAIIIMTDQKPDTELNIESLDESSCLEFRSADLWELVGDKLGTEGYYNVEPDFYNFYGQRIHKSRVYRLEGKQAPSFLKRRLRGWGMSELEKLVRSINQYMKNQNVIFELMDEAKVDIYQIEGFNSALMTKNGTDSLSKRIQLANQMKNFQNALTMDTRDAYSQKQMNFTGLSELLKQIREGIAADLKMPVTKLFGISSAGFNSGEDDIENYNSMIESEIRSKIKFIVLDVVNIVCQKLFGFIPEDLDLEFPELRMMSTEQEEIVKTNQYNRIISSYQSGLISGQEAKQSLNQGSLLPIMIDEDEEVEAPIQGDFIAKNKGVDG